MVPEERGNMGLRMSMTIDMVVTVLSGNYLADGGIISPHFGDVEGKVSKVRYLLCTVQYFVFPEMRG